MVISNLASIRARERENLGSLTRMTNSDSLREIAWPLSRLGEAIDSLARRSGLSPRTAAPPGFSREWNDDDLGTWIVSTTEWLGLEAEPRRVHVS